MISIIDYNLGNLESIMRAFKKFNIETIVTRDPVIIKKSKGIVLPGVGSFRSGMRGLKEYNLIDLITKEANNNKPLLGICLGAQLLLSESNEFGKHPGLNLIPGQVINFKEKNCLEKIPHVGWNKLTPGPTLSWDNSILKDIPPSNSYFYFVHSFIMEPKNESHILANSIYGNTNFCAAVQKNKIYGCQFHPEKSGHIGLKIIENFITISHK